MAKIPTGDGWSYEIKLDGYRLEVVKTIGKAQLYSRNKKSLTDQFPCIVAALEGLPADTVVDGELCAVDEKGRPNFNMLQNSRPTDTNTVFFAFDILAHKNRDLTGLPLSERRMILESVLTQNKHVVLSAVSSSGEDILRFVKDNGLEGVVAKHTRSLYLPGRRSAWWVKKRINSSQDFVIGGYMPSHLGIDSLLFGVYQGRELQYTGKVAAGFVPATRREVFEKIKHLATESCPFTNLPEKREGKWGEGLTAAKMKRCVWLRPEAVAQVEFVEWTPSGHLRHTCFIRLLDDKAPKTIMGEV